MRKLLSTILIFAMVFSFVGCGSKSEETTSSSNDVSLLGTQPKENELSPFTARWQGQGDDSHWTIDIDAGAEQSNILVSDADYGFFFLEMNWIIRDKQLVLTMNNEEHRITMTL